MDKEVSLTSGPADYITFSDVTRSYITANTEAFENGIYRPRAGKVKRFAAGFTDTMLETRKLKDSLMIFGGQGVMAVGGLFGEDSSLSEWGKEIVRTGSRQIAAIDAENAKRGFDIEEYEKDTWSYKIGSGFSSVVQMLFAAYATGGIGGAVGLGAKAVSGVQKAAAVLTAGGQEISSEVQEGIKNYQEKTGDKDFTGYTSKEAGKEFLTTGGYAAAAGALEALNLTRIMPFLKEGKKVIPNFAKGAFSEGVTESLQELANIGFDLTDGTIDFSKMPERLYGMLEQGVIGALVGGTTAGAFSVRNRAKIKNYLREELAGTVPDADLNDVVNTVYDAGIDTMAGIVTTELSHSESLRNKHGDIYRSMMTAIDKALDQAGGVSESAVFAQTDEVVEPLKDFGGIKEYPIVEFPVDQIELSRDVPNFKEGANESGVVEGEELGGSYERLGTPPIVIWERLDGRHEVITGRHRLDLARRTGESTIPAQIVKEADGFTVRDAQRFDVESNIKDEKGTTKDYVRYFESEPELSEEAAYNRGILSRQKARNAFRISRYGSADVRSQFLSGKISERKAVAISEGAPRSDAAQAAGLSRAGKLSAEELKAFVSIINQAVPENANKAEQGDLFGFDDSYLKEQEKIASMVAKDKSFIGEKIRAVKGALRNPQAAEEMGLKFEATPENIAAEVEKLNMQSAALDRFYLNSDLMRYYRNKINGKDAGSLDDILNLSVVSESAVEPDPNQGTLFQKGVGGLSALFTDEAARATYVSETAAMFADQVLAEANFRKTSIDSVLKASDIVFEDGGIKFKIGERIVDADGNVLEQAMYPSKIKTAGEFYDSVVNKEDERSRYFSYMTKDGTELALPDFVIEHDIKRHSLSRSEIETVFENIENIESFSLSEKETDLAKSSVLLKINTPDGAYGVAVALGKNKNYISTVFKSTGENGVNDWIKKGSSLVPSSQPTIIEDESSAVVTQGNPLDKIIRKAREKINTEYNQSAFAGSRVDYDKPSLEAIGSGEGQQVHGWGLYYALDKDVAERYREKFTDGGDRIEINGMTIGAFFRGLPGFRDYLGDINPDQSVKVYLMRRIDEYIKDFKQNYNEYKFSEFKDAYEKAEKIKETAEDIEESDFVIKKVGQVHEVDIPENPYLLDEQKPFDEQPEHVKNAIEDLISDNDDGGLFRLEDIKKVNPDFDEQIYYDDFGINPEFAPEKLSLALGDLTQAENGRDIYETVSRSLKEDFGFKNPDKAASELLSKYGIKGITYEGADDGRCFVIFDDKDVQVIQKFYQEKAGGGVKGSYSPYKRLLKITENADYSTLPHEFAHFWLSEMEGWVNSGLASEAYMDRYDIAMDWLGVEQGRPLTMREWTRAQERFARGYEQYLLNGNLPENPMNPIYAEYDRWLKAVYDDMNQPSKKPLTTDMVRFFQSMTTGTLPDTVLPPVNVDREKEKEEKGKKEVISKTETTTAADVSGQTESAGVSVPVVPLAVEVSAGKVSAAAERQNRLNKINGILKEDPQNVFYDPVTLEQSAQQAEMLIERDGLDGVRQMIDGEKPMPDNVIRTAVLIAYEQEMLKQGNTEEYLRVLRKHTLEQTRRGQEISAERINQDITNPSYWAKQAILGRKNSVSDVVFERIKKDGDTKEKAVDRFVSKTAAEYAEKLEKAENKDAVIKELNEKVQSVSDKQIELFQKENIAGKAYDAVYDEVGRWIEECFDVSLSVREMNVLTEKVNELEREFKSGLKDGQNPSVEVMAKIKEMRDTVAAMNPTNWLSLSVNSYGRAAMLSSVKSSVLNILSNAETFATEAIVRRVVTGNFEKAVDPAVVKEYLDYDFEVYKKSGVMMSVVQPEDILNPRRVLTGEDFISSAGEGDFRKAVRFMERLVFDWGLGVPDAKAKALSFVDNVALEATRIAKAEGLTGDALKRRATELFRDACLYQPKTAKGIDIRSDSINAAQVATFTNNGRISKMSGKVRNLINAATGKARLGDFIMPFVKTPANVVALGMEYSFGLGTAALHLPQILADVRAGTLSDVSRNVIRSSVRNGIGVALAALIASLFDPEDYISSFALATQKERDLVRFKNGVYNSIKIGGKYVSLDYFGPLAAPLVGWFEAKKARGLVEKVSSFVKASVSTFGNVPGIKELSSLTGWIDKAVSQPTERTLEDLWNGTTDQILARTVPAIISDIAKIVDPFERVSEDGVVGSLAAKIPVAREALAAKADISTGKEKASEGALSIMLFGARVKTAADSPVADEINRLSGVGEAPQLSDITRSFKGMTDKGKSRVRLEFAKGFVNQWGNKVDGYYERVSRLIKTEAYQAKTDAQKKEAINKIRQKVAKELKRKYGGS